MKTKMKNRCISLLLCFVMLIGILPFSVIRADALVAIPVTPENSSEVEATDEAHCVNIVNHPGTSFVLEHDHTIDVYDLWNEVDSEGAGELSFNQSFSINISDAIDVYNNYLDNKYPNGDRDHFKASEDINNNATFWVEARIWINNDNDLQFSSQAVYQLHPYDLRPYENFSYGKWSMYDGELSEEFFTMTAYDGVLDFSLNGTVKEIYDALIAQNESLGDVPLNNMSFEVWVSCEVEYMDWYIKSNETHFESFSLSLYDKHIYESESEYDTLTAIPTTSPIAVNVAPAFEECYEPVKTEYSWYYEFVKEGYDEVDGEWYGYFEKDETKESDVLTETGPSGTVFGVAYGVIDSGDKNYITLSDILNENNKDFINSFIGAKPMELGGMGQMFIGCTVTLTFADGKQYKVDIVKADYMTRLVAPCMHACTVCGFCTVTDEMLPCNFDQMYYDITNVCICDEPSVPQLEVTRESESEAYIESTGMTVTVVVDKIEVEEAPAHAFIVNVANAVGENNILALYNIDIFDEYGYPYTLNQWGDMGEELTVYVPVSMDEALAFQNGEATLYHISAAGEAEPVENVTVLIDGDAATMRFTSDSFSPFVIAHSNTVHYYGRDALSALTNSTALLYAYDQIAAGVEASAESIEIYNGVDTISAAELAMVMDVYRRDYAHHFWLGNSYSYSSNSATVVNVMPQYIMSGAELKAAQMAFEQKVTQILSGLTGGMNEFQRELYLHDALAGMITYAEAPNAHNAYGAIVEGKAVCEGYAEALQYLLQRAGIRSFIVLGTSLNPVTNTPENHAWNYVRIGGEYYHVDLTWDDQGENLFHAYFNQTDAVIQEDHTISTTDYVLPVCNSTTAQYFTGKDEYLDTYTVDEVGQLLKDNDLKVHVYIPGDVHDFLSWYPMNIVDIGTKAEVTGEFSYGYSQLGRELILYLSADCAHTSLTLQPAFDATCTDDGYRAHYKCSCGEYFEDASASIAIADIDAWKTGDGKIDKKGHDYTEQIKDAAHLKTAATKCTEYNVYWYDCSVCNANAMDDANAADKFYTSTEAGEHEFVEKLEDAAHLVAGTGANCQDAKEYYYDCVYCAEIGTASWVSTTMGDHEYDTDQWGYAEQEIGHAHKCKYCNEHDAVQPHTPGAPATEEDDQICTVCLIVLAPKTGHIHENHLTPVAESGATCTDDGYKVHYMCSCGRYFEDTSGSVEITDLAAWKAGAGMIVAQGHSWSDGTCTICGEEDPAYHIPGDINGDGMVNNKDATRLFQYLANWDVEVVEAALDVNGDGKINNKDATRLFQYLAHWNVEIF